MPFRRKRTFRKKSTTSVAHQALKLAKSLKKLINVEFKHVDTDTSSLNITTSGTFKFINPLIKGLEDHNMVGNTVRFKSLKVNIQFNYNTAGSDLQDIKYSIVKYHQPNNAGLPVLQDIWDGPDSLQMRSIDNMSNFTVLRTGNMVLNTELLVKTVRLNIPLNDISVYSGDDGNAVDLEKNLFFVLVTTSSSVNVPTMHIVSRMRFIDN